MIIRMGAIGTSRYMSGSRGIEFRVEKRFSRDLRSS